MSEKELKLNVPVSAQARVEQAVSRAKFSEIRLRALYFDTPSRDLVRARMALRLRLEGEQWVQTLKMPGEHNLSRIEINHNRPEATLDLSIYADTPAGDILSGLTEPLQVCYETDVKRLLRDIRTPTGTVELAFDRGWLRAGSLQLPISEVEFELKRGALEAIFAVGRQWLQKYGLILDFRSKAERGDLLAQLAQALKKLENPEAMDATETLEANDLPENAAVEHEQLRARLVADFWKPRGAHAISLESIVKQRKAAQTLAAITSECMEHIVRNTAILCEVDTAGICRASTPEHVHQLRVGIRRLRSAWAFFEGLTELPSLEHREQISRYFSQLGGTRDEDVLQETVLPALYAAGMPPVRRLVSGDVCTGSELVATPAFQNWLLDMLALCTITVSSSSPSSFAQHRPAPEIVSVTADSTDSDFVFPRAPREPREPSLKPLLIEKLDQWHRQVVRRGLKFSSLAIDQQHDLRKKSKRLRYALQFCESLMPESTMQRYRKQLAAVQDILGEMNDLYVAGPLFEAMKENQPQAWFACGWIQARLETLTEHAAEAFKRLAAEKPPWA